MPRSAQDVRRLGRIAKQDWGEEALSLGKRAAYLWCPDGVARSALVRAVEWELGEEATARNRKTLAKLAALTDR